jgi:integrase
MLRHTCAALLIDAGASPLRLQHWMGHHSAAFTLDNYGHLIDDASGLTSACQPPDRRRPSVRRP